MIFRYNLFIRKMRLFAQFYTHKNINQVTPRGAERMKEIIFKDSLQKYLAEKMQKANDLLCCEEYRAGYIEACREIFLYADFLSINKPKKL